MDEKSQNQMLWAMYYSFVITGLTGLTLGSYVPYIRSNFGINYELAGKFLSFLAIGCFISYIFSGILPTYLGRRKSAILLASWTVVAHFVFAIGIGTPFFISMAFFLAGLGKGSMSNFTNTLMTTVEGEKGARCINILHGCSAFGGLIGPIILVILNGFFPNNGWRGLSCMTLFMGIILLFVYSKMPIPDMPVKKHDFKNIDKSFLKCKRFYVTAFLLFLYMATEYAIVGWLVTYFQDTGILSENVSHYMNSTFWFFMFAGRFLGYFIIGKVCSREKILIIDSIGLAVFFSIMFFTKTAWVIVVSIIFVGLFNATIFPSVFSFGSSSFKGNDLGVSILSANNTLGGIITPAVIGYIAEYHGIAAGMWVVFVLIMLMCICIPISLYLDKKNHISYFSRMIFEKYFIY